MSTLNMLSSSSHQAVTCRAVSLYRVSDIPLPQVPPATCPSLLFVQRLITTGTVQYNDLSQPGQPVLCSLPGITSFDHSLLYCKCMPSSPGYDSTIGSIDALYPHIFAVNSMWASRDLLYSVVLSLAKLHGWGPRKDGTQICCNRKKEEKIKSNDWSL